MKVRFYATVTLEHTFILQSKPFPFNAPNRFQENTFSVVEWFCYLPYQLIPVRFPVEYTLYKAVPYLLSTAGLAFRILSLSDARHWQITNGSYCPGKTIVNLPWSKIRTIITVPNTPLEKANNRSRTLPKNLENDCVDEVFGQPWSYTWN